jgi:hypothetical protein
MEYFYAALLLLASTFVAYAVTTYFVQKEKPLVQLTPLKSVVAFFLNHFVFMGWLTSAACTAVLVVVFRPMIIFRALRRTCSGQCRKLGFFCKLMIVCPLVIVVGIVVVVSIILACALFAIIRPEGVLRFVRGKSVEIFRHSYS